MNGPSKAAFREALARLGVIQRDIAAISASDATGWRHDLIALRRELQTQITALSPLLDAIGDGDMTRPLRDAINRMRSTVALHQANWPAVSIDRADPDYRASVQDVRTANRDLIALADRLFAAVDLQKE